LELERCTKLRSFRHGSHDFVAALRGAGALKKHNDNTLRNYLSPDSKDVPGLSIDPKTKELLVIVACIAQNDRVAHMQCHMWAAHKAGASPDEILAVIYFIGQFVGGIAKLNGLEAWRATFRPDLPSVDRVAELGEFDFGSAGTSAAAP
jgi:alkylhydroperoxidase/carboxymuconolactone decarboxylase family protein YurZ